MTNADYKSLALLLGSAELAFTVAILVVLLIMLFSKGFK